MESSPSSEYDAFIVHATEDKSEFVRPLAAELAKYGLNIWFDESTLKVGDSLRDSIECGLSRSRFGVVVFSESFFAKNWPPAELNALFAREMASGEKVILPIWHNVTLVQMLQFAPIQAAKVAAMSSEGISNVAKKLIAVIRPEALQIDTTRRDLEVTNRRLSEQFEEKYPGYGIRTMTGTSMRDLPREADVIASQWSNGVRTDIVVVDPSAAKKQPLKIGISFVGSGITKFQEMLSTGRAQELLATEFKNVRTNVPLAEREANEQETYANLRIVPKLPASRKVIARVVFGSEQDQVIFPIMEFSGVRAGIREVEVSGTREQLPFALHLTIPLDGRGPGAVQFELSLLGKDFREIQRFFRVIQALRKHGLITATDLETDRVLFQGVVDLEPEGEEVQAFQKFLDEIVSVEDFYNVALVWPAEFNENDFHGLEILKSLKDGTPSDVTITFASVTTKSESKVDNQRIAENLRAGTISVWLEPEEVSRFGLFGVQVFEGPIRVIVNRAEVINRDVAVSAFEAASAGDIINVEVQSRGPVRYEIVNQSAVNPKT
jgi:hypothetical protein